ncbi:MAG: hypothetical protein PHO06_03045 [Clostridia bacterium]|jgi:hypothetical protein|nr:hypothetical protein [Clostridia bacterium]MDD4408524.1 hypothetical protein [Clostridia bacterium]
MKQKLTRFVAVLCIIPLFFLSGCLFLGEFDFGEGAGSDYTSFKACYRAESYEQDNTVSAYANLIVEQLYANFGILNDEDIPSKIPNKPNASSNENYDKIRVQTQLNDINKDITWRWTFSQKREGANSLNVGTGAVEHYQTPAVQSAYYSAFVPVYSIAMEIVLYEIMIGQTPTIFTIDVDHENDTNAVYFDSARTKEIYVAPNGEDECPALSEVKNIFAEKAIYVGLTEEDVVTLEDYILNQIIGENLINSEAYNRVFVGGQEQPLDYVVNQILTLEIGEEMKSIYSPYPASYVQNFAGNSLYINSDSPEALSHIPAREYQSLAVIPAISEHSLLSIWIAFECEYNITIDISLNFYDSNLNIYSTIQTLKDFEIPAGVWNPGNIIDFNCNSNYKISPITTSEISAFEPTVINNSVGTANYYNILENGNNKIGILNHNKINQSYYEFTFEIHKNASRDYFPFKSGVLIAWDS